MKKIFLLFFISLLLFSIFTSAYAGLVPCGLSEDDPEQPGDQTVPCTLCHFFVMIERWVKGLLIPTTTRPIPIVLIIATLMIAIGGFMYVIAFIGMGEGGPEMISRAKRLFGAVAIGLLIIYGAWLVINTFLWAIGAKIAGFWNEIPCP